MQQPNGNSSSEPEDLELKALLARGVATFKTAMAQGGMIASPKELKLVADVLFLVTDAVIQQASARSILTLKIIFNFLSDIVAEEKPNNRVVRMIKSIQGFMIDGKKDANIQEHLERMEVRQKEAKEKGHIN